MTESPSTMFRRLGLTRPRGVGVLFAIGSTTSSMPVRRPERTCPNANIKWRYGWDLVFHLGVNVETSSRPRAMAAELTLRRFFIEIPVVVLGLVIFRVVGGLERRCKLASRIKLYSFFECPRCRVEYLRGKPEEIENSRNKNELQIATDGWPGGVSTIRHRN